MSINIDFAVVSGRIRSRTTKPTNNPYLCALFIRKSERILLSSPASRRTRYSSGAIDAAPPLFFASA